jgi:RNA polymerase sigma factor (sigma-70 family)
MDKIVMRNYITLHYEDLRNKFRGLCYKRLFKRNNIDDLFSDMLLKILETCDKYKKVFKNENECSKYISVCMINAIYWSWKTKKNELNEVDISEFELADVDHIEEKNIKIENDLKVIEIEKWMKANLNMFEEGLLKMWYINNLTYDEMNKLSNFDKTFIFKTVKSAKEKLRKQFNDRKE